jgi:hypothetical protein
MIVLLVILAIVAAQENDFCKKRKANQVKKFIESEHNNDNNFLREKSRTEEIRLKWRDIGKNNEDIEKKETVLVTIDQSRKEGSLNETLMTLSETQVVYMIICAICFVVVVAGYLYLRRENTITALRKEKLRGLKKDKEAKEREKNELEEQQSSENAEPHDSTRCENSNLSIPTSSEGEEMETEVFAKDINGSENIALDEKAVAIEDIPNNNDVIEKENRDCVNEPARVPSDRVLASHKQVIAGNDGEVVIREFRDSIAEGSSMPHSVRKALRLQSFDAAINGDKKQLKILYVLQLLKFYLFSRNSQSFMEIESLSLQQDLSRVKIESVSLSLVLLSDEIETVKTEKLNSKFVVWFYSSDCFSFHCYSFSYLWFLFLW